MSFTRRTAIAAAAGLGAAASLGVMAPLHAQPASRKTFVLIHGAFHGGWCWKFVSDLLEKQGHKVYAPSLSGNADRGHLLSAGLTLEMQAMDIAGLIEFEDLRDVCLVAHSYGGWPTSAALEKIADRVGSLVLLDAFKPKDGERAADYISEFSRKALEEALARGEAGRKSPPAKTFSIVEKHYPWIEQRLSQQPNSIVFNPIRLTGKLETVAKKTYIRAPRYPQAAFDKAFEECKANPTWRTMTVENSGHDVMIDQPEWLADVLIKAA